ncbi:Transglutaminase-like superfamily protein [Chitinophaga jiangningensis]|uniref:Transglutaminase-like superfamily protein n=1 Tax=Chitinophaga jiangningensis TaxID=1419482 RepID=A0A1M7A0F0_9BACT|nr:DUF3857 domain-containing protein [Chitinophaga jiangningensis]SHL36130.1 Transglutaminase-like superfamily protein [Chitinophaga jiangningensis]
MKRVVSIILLTLCPYLLMAGDYEKAWEALHKNDFKSATIYLEKTIKSGGPKKNSAIVTMILLKNMIGYDNDFTSQYFNPLKALKNPAPYAYAMWFLNPVLGQYGVKTGVQLENLQQLCADTLNYNGSINAAATYFMGLQNSCANNKKEAARWYHAIGALEEWSYVGPFDNVMGSGFDKDYGPLKSPQGTAFTSSNNNSPVNWFSPLYTTREGWNEVSSFFPVRSAVGYAQTFVNAPADMDPILCMGATAAMKVWVNDKLVMSQPQEMVTEMDWWKVKVHLNKGFNRVLVQIGFTENTSHPNFILRFTDDHYRPLKGLVSQPLAEKYQTDMSASAPELIPHFAEDYFRKQLALQPEDPINAVLLSRVFIRNQEWDKAKSVMKNWYKTFPKDAFLLNYYVECMSGANDRSDYEEGLETLKNMLPDNYWVLYSKAVKLENEKSYSEAMELVDKMITIEGERSVTTLKKLQLFAMQKKLDSMVQQLKFAYEKYPDNYDAVQTMYIYESRLNNNPVKGAEVLQKYCDSFYNFNMHTLLRDVYLNQGKTDEALRLMHATVDMAPYDLDAYSPLIRYYFGSRQYDSAIHYLNIQHKISPYYHQPIGDIASCYMQLKQNDSAVANFKRALAMHAGGFDYREQLRMLEKQTPIEKYFPVMDYYSEIKDYSMPTADTSQPYAYIFDEKNVVLYPEGASEQTINTAVYLSNKKGISRWKEISLPYNGVYQELIIVKAEAIKPSGARIPAETDGNDIVFTKLDVGDVVYYSYKVRSVGRGRLKREFWDKFYFSDYVPAKVSAYNVLVADTVPLYYEYRNGAGDKPKISKHDQFKLYSWRKENIKPIRKEYYMPNVSEVGEVLHVSTVKDWDVIAEWYSDITREQSREDFEINEAFKEIFPNGTANLDDLTKARKIYDYIEDRISYSSVSFRQGAYVPQKAGKTLITKLGDCKDLSTLFLAFARKAGLPANLILVSTREYGEHNMQLPSLDFNHCIIAFKANNKTWYQELTSNTLPFGVVPTALAGAQILNIPYDFKPGEKLGTIPASNYTKKSVVRRMDVTVKGTDAVLSSNCAYVGEVSEELRADYLHKTPEDVKDGVQNRVSRNFKNQVVLDNYSITNLDNRKDTLWLNTSFTVKNEVINVGDIHMIKLPFMDVVATADIFTAEPRQFPFVYADYEQLDDYITEMHVHLSGDIKFDQLPSATTLKMGEMSYSLEFNKVSDTHLVVTRHFSTDSNKTIPAAAWKELETFFNGIVKSEQKYISFR